MKKVELILLIVLLALGMGLYGCSGDDGDDGVAGAPGAPGEPGPAGPAGPVTTTDESCAVCHASGKIGDFADNHMYKEDGSPKVIRQNVTATINSVSNIGGFPVINFSVDAGSAPYTALTVANLRVVIADIIPAGTVTVDLDGAAGATKTYGSDYLENWMYETGTGTLDTTDAANGNYIYTSAIPFGGLSATRANNNEYAATNQKRVYMRVSESLADFNGDGATFDMAAEPALGAAAVKIDMQDQYITFETCQSCHGEQMDKAAHASSYFTPSCGMCHSPLSGRDPATRAAFTASMIHRIHAAIDIPEFATRINGNGYVDVTYPKNIADCTVCHTTEGADTIGIDVTTIDNWKNNPTIEVCSSCHDVTFGASATHTGGTQVNAACNSCHPASGNGFGQSVTTAHAVTTLKSPDKDGNPVSITPNYTASISLSAPANGSYYVAGETPLVTVTTDIAGADYTSADFSGASLYVYGPRAKALPVLTTGSTTDPAYDGTALPVQSHNMLSTSTDPQVQTDASGFKYQLLAIPEDLASGTYMVQVAIGHTSSRVTGSRNYKIDGWALKTIQIGTATDEPKVAGDCTSCHTQEDWGSMYHRSYFGTDGCLACHDQSGNHADPIANRVHAVHAASADGDLLGLAWDGSSEDLPYISYPQNTLRCEACHNSGNESYKTEPVGQWGAPCIGCHGAGDGLKDHMIQNGSPFAAH